MEVHFTPELQAKLETIAAGNRRGADEYVQQLVENYLEYDAWFRQEVAEGLAQLDRGEFLTHEEVGARLQKGALERPAISAEGTRRELRNEHRNP